MSDATPPSDPLQPTRPTRHRRLELVIEGLLLATPIALVLAFGEFGVDAAAAGAPAIRSAAPGEVVLQAPADPERRATRAREAELAQRPKDPRLAAEVARRHIEDARRNNDPRALGWAEATLAPWSEDADAPSEILVLRATIRQSRHDFARALSDLDRVLARDPNHGQAALTRATVLGVIGRAAEARPDCEAVRRAGAHPIVAATCHATLDGLVGKADEGRRRLDAVLGYKAATPIGPSLESWALGTRGELDYRLGDLASADRDLRRALELAPGDAWTTATLADVLLDAGRPSEALPLVADSDVDNLVLRRALAKHAAGADATPELATLRARYAAAHAREDAQHLREEARFVLAFEADPARALALARANWDHQREPADVRIYLEAALAASSPDEAKPALEFVRASGLADHAMAALVARLEALRGTP